MKIKAISRFKNPVEDLSYFQSWVSRLEASNKTNYYRIDVSTSLGNTTVWTINYDKTHLTPVLIFPGFRTSSLFWDFDSALDPLRKNHRIYLIETNGQPSFSDGNTPDIRSDGYGIWANEVMIGLGLSKAVIAGASFGGLVCMKLCITAPEKIEMAIMLNPGCLQSFSLSPKNLYYNLLPIISPTKKNVRKFLDAAVFCKPHHQLSVESEELIVDYETFALSRFIDKGQTPYKMSEKELSKVLTPVYLLVGDKDILFPFKRSIAYAKRHINNLKEVFVLKNTAHGIETSKEAIKIVASLIKGQ